MRTQKKNGSKKQFKDLPAGAKANDAKGGSLLHPFGPTKTMPTITPKGMKTLASVL